MTGGELLARYNVTRVDPVWTDFALQAAAYNSAYRQWLEGKSTHWLAAKMSETRVSYCLSCNAFHFGDCPAPATRPGTMPNPYTSVDTKPEPTEAQKALQRAVRIVSEQ